MSMRFKNGYVSLSEQYEDHDNVWQIVKAWSRVPKRENP